MDERIEGQHVSFYLSCIFLLQYALKFDSLVYICWSVPVYLIGSFHTHFLADLSVIYKRLKLESTHSYTLDVSLAALVTTVGE